VFLFFLVSSISSSLLEVSSKYPIEAISLDSIGDVVWISLNIKDNAVIKSDRSVLREVKESQSILVKIDTNTKIPEVLPVDDEKILNIIGTFLNEDKLIIYGSYKKDMKETPFNIQIAKEDVKIKLLEQSDNYSSCVGVSENYSVYRNENSSVIFLVGINQTVNFTIKNVEKIKLLNGDIVKESKPIDLYFQFESNNISQEINGLNCSFPNSAICKFTFDNKVLKLEYCQQLDKIPSLYTLINNDQIYYTKEYNYNFNSFAFNYLYLDHLELNILVPFNKSNEFKMTKLPPTPPPTPPASPTLSPNTTTATTTTTSPNDPLNIWAVVGLVFLLCGSIGYGLWKYYQTYGFHLPAFFKQSVINPVKTELTKTERDFYA